MGDSSFSNKSDNGSAMSFLESDPSCNSDVHQQVTIFLVMKVMILLFLESSVSCNGGV